jgi:cytochrome oxidase Cu insertion factor (SCO1/SenC/PrrC family)
MKALLLSIVAMFAASGCASYDYPAQVTLGEAMISIEGESLAGDPKQKPKDFAGQPTLLLFGYVHKSQFDIDRWLIGLNMRQADVVIYEIPAIKNIIGRMFSTRFDNSMREGIPKDLWREVITVYNDGDKTQKYTGNIIPKNARVLLLDANGNVVHFYDEGFSVPALNGVLDAIASLTPSDVVSN